MSVLGFNTNILSLIAQRGVRTATDDLSRTAERLASGQRISRASDDSAGLALLTSLKSDARLYGQAVRNVNDSVSLFNITENALSELLNITTRQQELAEQASNGAYSFTQRQALDQEANALVKEFNRIVAGTQFNGISLLDVRQSPGSLQVEAGGSVISFTWGDSLTRTAGTGTFSAATSASVGTASSWALTSADFNGDGIVDLASGDNTGGLITVSLGNGDGTYRIAYTATAIGSSLALATGDVNGDGILDLVGSDGQAAVFLGNGDGTFAAPLITATETSNSWSIKVDDVDSDGHQDLVIADITDGVVRVALGNGDGTFAASNSFVVGTEPHDIAIADFNRDGVLDVIATNYNNGTVDLILGNGDGTFQAKRVSQLGNSLQGIATEDFNHDGYEDAVVGNGTVLLGNGDGTFSQQELIPFDYFATWAGTADLNGDGYADAVFGFGSNFINIALGKGDGTFEAVSSIATSTSGHSQLVLADTNGDGAVDLTQSDGAAGRLYTFSAITQQISTQGQLNLLSRAHALTAMETLASQRARIEDELGTIGAAQSRLTFTLNVVRSRSDTLAAAASRIGDIDVAQEVALYVKAQVQRDAATALLAQANQVPNMLLDLLG